MANDGVPIGVIQLIGGWKDRRMVERYVHLGDRRLAAAMEQLDALVSGERTSQWGARPRTRTPNRIRNYLSTSLLARSRKE